jgi:hypothetical protein
MDKLIANSPHLHVPPIIGQPTYATLAQLHIQLNATAALVHSNLGNGLLSLLQLTVSNAVYNTLSATPFIHPAVNPDITVIIPSSSIGAVIAKANPAHDATTALFKQYDLTDKALKQQIVGAIQVRLLNHLYATYANIITYELLTNDTAMKPNYNTNQPIAMFFDQIKNAVNFAATGSCPYTPAQVNFTA